MPRTHLPRTIPCPINGCKRLFTKKSGLSNHLRTHQTPRVDHAQPLDFEINPVEEELRQPSPINGPPEPVHTEHHKETVTFHPFLNGQPSKNFIDFCASFDK